MVKELAVYMKSDTVRASFADVLGNDREAGIYISSVLLAVSNGSEELQASTQSSIYSAALRCATMRLSVDPAFGHASLVPFKNKEEKYIATLIVQWRGYHFLAMRTGKYRFINVAPIYEGEIITEDRITGEIKLSGGKLSDKRAGWIGAFEMMSGFRKVIYMTFKETPAIGKEYSRRYQSEKGYWQKHPEVMEKKTVYRRLLTHFGYLDPRDIATVSQIETVDIPDEGETVEGDYAESTPESSAPAQAEREPSLASEHLEPPAEKRTPESVIKQMGFE